MKKLNLIIILCIAAISCSKENQKATSGVSGKEYTCDYTAQGKNDPTFCLQKACIEAGGNLYEKGGVQQCGCNDGVFIAGTKPLCVNLESIESKCVTLSTEDNDLRSCDVTATLENAIYTSSFKIPISMLTKNINRNPESYINHRNSQQYFPYIRQDSTSKLISGYEVRPSSDLDIYSFLTNEVKNLANLKYEENEDPYLAMSYHPYVHYYSIKNPTNLVASTMNRSSDVKSNVVPRAWNRYKKQINLLIATVQEDGLRQEHPEMFEHSENWDLLSSKNNLGCYEGCTLIKNVNPNLIGASSRPIYKRVVHMENSYIVRNEWSLIENSTLFLAVTSKDNSISYIVILPELGDGVLLNSDLEIVSKLNSAQLSITEVSK